MPEREPSPHRARALACVTFLAATLLGCVSAPSPLAPGLRGSIGLPHQGVLTQAASLPSKGEGYQRLRKDDIRWGNARLVKAIEAAAARVHASRPGGSPLIVGDLSAPQGGAASGHRSHRSGRDADLLFYASQLQGASTPSPGFVHFGPDGLASTRTEGGAPYVRLDIPRNWELVKALVLDTSAQVQWLFVAHWLEALLLEQGKALQEDPELLWIAESVLQQPGDSAVHDDHLHLRIGCSPDDSVQGCISGGPAWPWFPRMTAAPLASELELLAAILESPAPTPSLLPAPESRSAPLGPTDPAGF